MKSSFVILLLMLAGLLFGVEVRAEAFVDLYAGGAFTRDRGSDLVIPPQFFNPSGASPPGAPHQIIRQTRVGLSFDDSIAYGMRGGYWFGKWFGLALDVFTFEPNVNAEGFTLDKRGFPETADVRVIPISALMMLRWPLLASDEYPLGRLHSYVGGGPSLFLTKFEGDVDLAIFDFPSEGPVTAPPVVNVEPAGEFSSKNVDPGMELLVGLDFQILPFVGVFAEYRYTLAEPVWSDTVPASVNYPAVKAEFQVPLRTHHIVGGITFRFW